MLKLSNDSKCLILSILSVALTVGCFFLKILCEFNILTQRLAQSTTVIIGIVFTIILFLILTSTVPVRNLMTRALLVGLLIALVYNTMVFYLDRFPKYYSIRHNKTIYTSVNPGVDPETQEKLKPIDAKIWLIKEWLSGKRTDPITKEPIYFCYKTQDGVTAQQDPFGDNLTPLDRCSNSQIKEYQARLRIKDFISAAIKKEDINDLCGALTAINQAQESILNLGSPLTLNREIEIIKERINNKIKEEEKAKQKIELKTTEADDKEKENFGIPVKQTATKTICKVKLFQIQKPKVYGKPKTRHQKPRSYYTGYNNNFYSSNNQPQPPPVKENQNQYFVNQPVTSSATVYTPAQVQPANPQSSWSNIQPQGKLETKIFIENQPSEKNKGNPIGRPFKWIGRQIKKVFR